MTRLSLQVFYLCLRVSSTAPLFILWWSNLEILVDPLHRSSPFIGELSCQSIQMEHGPYIAERTQKAVYTVRCLLSVVCTSSSVARDVFFPDPTIFSSRDPIISFIPWSRTLTWKVESKNAFFLPSLWFQEQSLCPWSGSLIQGVKSTRSGSATLTRTHYSVGTGIPVPLGAGNNKVFCFIYLKHFRNSVVYRYRYRYLCDTAS
jgi:hypothetical protein